MITFQPLHDLIEQGKTSYYYLEKHGIDHKIAHKIRHDQNITLKTLNEICTILNCQPGDIIHYVEDKKEN